MISKDKYITCEVAGDGKLFRAGTGRAEYFKIINMSASGIRIETTAVIPEGIDVALRIRFIGCIMDAVMDVSGIVAKKYDNGYEIEFTSLTEEQEAEVDEMLRTV